MRECKVRCGIDHIHHTGNDEKERYPFRPFDDVAQQDEMHAEKEEPDKPNRIENLNVFQHFFTGNGSQSHRKRSNGYTHNNGMRHPKQRT